MMNKHRGETTIKLGDEEILMRMTFGAICEIEEHTGKTALELVQGLTRERIGIKDAAVVIWAGMRGAMSPSERAKCPTIGTIGERIFQQGITDFFEPVGSFMVYAFASPEAQQQIEDELGKDEPPASEPKT